MMTRPRSRAGTSSPRSISPDITPVHLPVAVTCPYVGGGGLGLSSRDGFCFVVEYAARNLAIATVVGASLLGQTEFVLFAAAFFLIQVPLMLVAIAFQRLRGSD